MGKSIDVARALKQSLQTDQMLGVSAVPISKSKVAEQRNRKPAAIAAASTPRDKAAAFSSDGDKAERLLRLNEDHVRNCQKCHLAGMRTQTVFGEGNPNARIAFVGEAPGFEEDRQGRPFVGKAGQLLNAMIEKGMGLRREDVYICNVIKCRPPNNRTPSTDEMAGCSPYMFEQLRILLPEVIIAMGAPASQTVLNTRESIGRLRGRFHDFYPSGVPGTGPCIPVMPTYHPAYLLRCPWEKVKTWEDLKLVMQRLNLPIPEQYR